MPLRLNFAILSACSLLALASCSNRLADFEDLMVGTSAGKMDPPSGKDVHITYLGTNGYLVRSHDTTIVVDPYFSRIPMRDIVFNAPVEPSRRAILDSTEAANFPARVDGFLVTHSHFDHHFDIPMMQRIYGGSIIGSKTAAFLAEASGIRRQKLLPSLPGDVHRLGSAKIRVLEAEHDKVLGRVPYPGAIESSLTNPPDRPKDWRLGLPLAYLIELEGKRIYIESGGKPGHVPSVENVDIAVIGVAVEGSQKRYPDAIRQLNPSIVIPSHQDNFFLPMSGGFHFSTLSNFPKIIATHEEQKLPGRIVFLDYFDAISADDILSK